MAEAELIVASLLEKLEAALSKSSGGAKKLELESLRNELDVLNSAIAEAESYRKHEDITGFSQWVKQMSEMA